MQKQATVGPLTRGWTLLGAVGLDFTVGPYLESHLLPIIGSVVGLQKGPENGPYLKPKLGNGP